MTIMKLIDKDKVVAEINRIVDVLERNSGYGIFIESQMVICEKILSFLDTIEVKKVDLEKEFDKYTKNILACDVQFEPFTHLYNCAKYFYELGLNAQKEE